MAYGMVGAMSSVYCAGLWFFLFMSAATTAIYTLSLHDALPISASGRNCSCQNWARSASGRLAIARTTELSRSEEHTSELQSRQYLVCRLLLEKKKKEKNICAYNSCLSKCSTTRITRLRTTPIVN